jgi:hypothetical protein
MFIGNRRYLKWIVDGLCAIAAIFVAFLVYFAGVLGYSIMTGEMDLGLAIDNFREALNEPLYWLQVMIFWGPAALFGFIAARLVSRRKSFLFATAGVAALTSFVVGIFIGGSMFVLMLCLTT